MTIFGQSTGAVSVHTHLLAEDDEDLFQAAIAQSGTVLTNFGHDVLANSMKAVQDVGCHSEEYSHDDVHRCLQSVSLESLIEQPFHFWPVYDRPSIIPRIPFKPSSMIDGARKKIPFLIGINTEEAANLANENAYQAAPALMRFVYKDGYVQLATDAWFGMPAYQAYFQHGKHAPVYGYILAELCAASEPSSGTGVTHGEDLNCLFYRENRTGGDSMVKSWTNFAKYHDPSPSWDAVPGWRFAKGARIGIFGDMEKEGKGLDNIVKRIEIWNKLGNEVMKP